MSSRLRGLALTVVLCSGVAHAQERPPVERYETKLPVSDYRAGAARTTVSAPQAAVLAVVSDYGRYAGFITRFEAAKVVGHHGDCTDVYLRVTILKGAAKIWAVVRFEPARSSGDSTTIVAHELKGNVKRLDAVWHVRAVDSTHTRVALELLIVPDIPAPEALVVHEVRDAAGTAVSGVRDESERRATGP